MRVWVWAALSVSALAACEDEAAVPVAAAPDAAAPPPAEAGAADATSSDTGTPPPPDAAPASDAGAADAGDAAVFVTHENYVECGTAAAFTLEETDTLRLTPRCDGGAAHFENLPDGASLSGGALVWTPLLDQAGPFTLDLVDGAGARTAVTGWVLDRFDAPGNLPLVNRAQYTQEHGLPVIHLTWHAAEPTYCRDAVARPAVPADIQVGDHAYVGAELRCRGQTSIAFPKKSFTLRFAKDDPFRAPAGLEQFAGRRRLALTQSLDDNSQLRTRLGFELWNRVGTENVQLDHASAVVFVDGEYQGLYTVTDSIGDHLLAARGLDEDSQVFESVDHRGDYRARDGIGNPKPNVHVGYEKSDGEPEEDFSSLDTLLHWVSDSTDETFVSTIDTTLKSEDFYDWYVFATAIMARDSYAKNSYVFIDTDGPDPRWRYLPWDMNESFGQSWTTSRVAYDFEAKRPPWATQRNGIWERFVNIPVLAAHLDARYADALAGPLARAAVLALYDDLHAQVRPSALRDDRKWDTARRSYPLWSARTDFTDFDGESTYLRAWIDQRWQLLETLY